MDPKPSKEQLGPCFSTVYDYKEDSVVVSDDVPGKGTLVTRYVDWHSCILA